MCPRRPFEGENRQRKKKECNLVAGRMTKKNHNCMHAVQKGCSGPWSVAQSTAGPSGKYLPQPYQPIEYFFLIVVFMHGLNIKGHGVELSVTH